MTICRGASLCRPLNDRGPPQSGPSAFQVARMATTDVSRPASHPRLTEGLLLQSSTLYHRNMVPLPGRRLGGTLDGGKR